MTSDESRLEILRKVADGTLTIEEGADLIGILERGKTAQQSESFTSEPELIDQKHEVVSSRVSGWWKSLWSLILIGGAILTGFSAFWAYQGYQKAGLGWGFWLAWIPFILGVLIMLFGWMMLESPWLHVKILSRDSGKTQKIALVIPLPLKLASWVFSKFGDHMPVEVQNKGVGELLIEIENSLQRGEPFQIEVDDKEDGDQVYISIAK